MKLQRDLRTNKIIMMSSFNVKSGCIITYLLVLE